jgi:hypothetical protein
MLLECRSTVACVETGVLKGLLTEYQRQNGDMSFPPSGQTTATGRDGASRAGEPVSMNHQNEAVTRHKATAVSASTGRRCTAAIDPSARAHTAP